MNRVFHTSCDPRFLFKLSLLFIEFSLWFMRVYQNIHGVKIIVKLTSFGTAEMSVDNTISPVGSI